MNNAAGAAVVATRGTAWSTSAAGQRHFVHAAIRPSLRPGDGRRDRQPQWWHFEAANVVQANGTGTFNFNGGTLMPSGNNTAFMTGLSAANVMQNGANINSNGNNITIGQSLQHAGSNNVDGGLVKSGPGTLTLTATQGYNGATIVTGGVLQLSNPNLALPPVAGYAYWFNAANLGLANGAAVTAR